MDTMSNHNRIVDTIKIELRSRISGYQIYAPTDRLRVVIWDMTFNDIRFFFFLSFTLFHRKRGVGLGQGRCLRMKLAAYLFIFFNIRIDTRASRAGGSWRQF